MCIRDRDAPDEPVFRESKSAQDALLDVLNELRALAQRITQSKRAKDDLANWQRLVKVTTAGGTFGFSIQESAITVLPHGDVDGEDLLLAVEDPAALLPWLQRGAALTNLIMDGTLWVNKSELETITRLDRLPRSLRRDGV